LPTNWWLRARVASVVAANRQDYEAVPNKRGTGWTRTDRVTAAVASVGLFVGIFVVVASLDSNESGINVGLALVVWNCVYGGLYFGRWYEARTIKADMMNLTELEPNDRRTLGGHEEVVVAEVAEIILPRLDREATESQRLQLMMSLLLLPNLFFVVSWIVTMYW
jgi:hypothetical protein